MEQTPITTVLTLTLLTVPAVTSVSSTTAGVDPPSVWLPEDKLLAPTPEAQLGTDLDADGDTAVVAAPGLGQVLVYERGISGWGEVAQLSSPEPADEFGSSVAIREDTIVVGARLADTASVRMAGAAYVFEERSQGWRQTVKLTADDASQLDVLGQAVAIHSDTIAVGAVGADTEDAENTGAVYLYHKSPTGWSQRTKLVSGEPSQGDNLGWAVNLGEDVVAAGTQGPNEVHVFEEDDGDWETTSVLSGPSTFGRTVAVGGTTLAAAAPLEDQVRIYNKAGSEGWRQVATLTPSDSAPLDRTNRFGASLSLSVSNEFLLIGASLGDRFPAPPSLPTLASTPCMGAAVTTTCEAEGAAYIYQPSSPQAWTLRAKLVPPDGLHSDRFGASVAITEHTAFVSAPERRVLPGVESGTAYAFNPAHEAVQGGI
jgi:hypothetical protein